MRKIAFAIISLALVLSVSFASAERVHQKTVGNNLPVLQNNYACNANAVDTIDLLCGLKAYYRFQEPAWDGSSGEVVNWAGPAMTVRENLVLVSEDMTGSGWSDSPSAPVVSATTVEDNSGAAFEYVIRQVTAIAPGIPYTYSVSVPKAGSAPAHYAGISIISKTKCL